MLLFRNIKMSVRFITLLIVTLSLIFLFYPANIYAKDSDQVVRASPVILNLSLSPGKVTTIPLSLENLTDNPLPLRVSVEGFDSSDEEYGVTTTTPTEVSPLVHWITVDPAETILAP